LLNAFEADAAVLALLVFVGCEGDALPLEHAGLFLLTYRLQSQAIAGDAAKTVATAAANLRFMLLPYVGC
jgi:hypothetical protein